MATEGMPESMEREVYKAAVNGDVTLFRNHFKKDQLLKKTHQNNNILHISAQHEKERFIKAVLNNFSKNTCETLMCEQNLKGNTALHIAAEVGDEVIVELLCKYYSDEVVGRVLPWRMLNSDGNTPAHLAILYGNVSVASYLVVNDSFIARIVNHSKQTLLHLAIRYHVQGTSEEDLWPIIEVLLNTKSSVACWADVEGWTPLHIAASLRPPRCLHVINALLESCPEAAEVHHEVLGDCVLHLLTKHQVPSYEEGVALLNIPEVYALRNNKNHLGDTPLHLAAMNNDRNMVRVLLGFSPKFNIKNKNGVTAGSLVQQLCVAPLDLMGSTEILVKGRRKLTKEEYYAAEKANFTLLNEKLDSMGMHFLASQAPKGGNILHILMGCNLWKLRDYGERSAEDFIGQATDFIGQAIRKFPLLITQQDGNGDTPIHVLVGNNTLSLTLLKLWHRIFEMARASDVASGTLYSQSPWRIKNVKGDTPLHVAARSGCDRAVLKLLEFDEEVVEFVNNRKETPLHLRCYMPINNMMWRSLETVESMMSKGNGFQTYMQDVDGFTPLHIAISNNNVDMVDILLFSSPDCLKIADIKGRTPWHMAGYRWKLKDRWPTHLFNYKDPGRIMVTSKDNDGNTPLHLAIANQNFEFAKYYLDTYYLETHQVFDASQLRAHLEVDNNDGISCYDLIGSAEHLPREFEKFLWEKNISLYGYRSMYGVPTTKIYDYANTIGVIAALLATITFTAGFTVPGGLDSNNGTPLLLRKAAFKLFMVSNVIALCLSVMVLFCLLWIMTTSNKRESLLLLDTSVLLLETSFYATLLTFMTGIYITTVSIVQGIAIFTCVICSLLILVMRKSFVMVTIVPFCGGFISWSQVIKEYVSIVISIVRFKFFGTPYW